MTWTTGKVVAASIGGLVVVIGLSIGGPIACDAINAKTAPVTSQLQEKSQVYTAQNRINQYNLFYNEYETYLDDLQAVKSNVAALDMFNREYPASVIAADPTGALQQEQGEDAQAVTGAQQICAQSANAFNQDSRKVQTGAIFKGVNLAKQVSVTACTNGSSQ
jgi:hypothetical protein